MPNSKPAYRALIVDDMKEMRALIAKALGKEGIESHEAADSIAASNAMRLGARFDVVTVDLAMPREHGHKLVQEILSRANPPMVVVITGITDPRILSDLVRRGVADVIYKPFDIAALGAKIAALLDYRTGRGNNAPSAAGPAGGGQRTPVEGVTEQIAGATATLQIQLEIVQKSFQETIASLEKQRDQLESDLLGSVRMLTNLIEQVGAAHGSHPIRVERIAGVIATKAGLSATQQRDLKVAALLHEIGQFGMPDAIKNKRPIDMNMDDRLVFEKYPTIGALLLSEIPGMSRVAPIVASHTERFDGSGYPAGIKGAEIPTEARILAIADGLDTARQYSAGMDDAEFLARQSNSRFDPSLAALAVVCVREMALENAPGRRKMQMPVPDIYPGLVLADGLYDERGLLLARSDIALTQYAIDQIRRLVPNLMVSVYTPQG